MTRPEDIDPSYEEHPDRALFERRYQEARRRVLGIALFGAGAFAASKLARFAGIFSYNEERFIANNELGKLVADRGYLATSSILEKNDIRTIIHSYMDRFDAVDRSALAKERGIEEKHLRRRDVHEKARELTLKDIREGKLKLEKPVPEYDADKIIGIFAVEFERSYEEIHKKRGNAR